MAAQDALQYDNQFGGLQTGIEGSTGLTQSSGMLRYIDENLDNDNTQTYVSQNIFLKTARVGF